MKQTRQWIAEKHLYLIVILLLIWIMAVRIPLDSDMWWHLRAGNQTLSQGSAYRVDTFSHTREGYAWINHSWLSQVIMAGIYRISNFAGLSIWVAVCAVVSLGLLYPQMEGHPLVRGLVLILAATVSSVVWSPRPQVMSLVMLALINLLVYKYSKDHNWFYLAGMPPVFALWGNLHGGYVIGIIYVGGVLAGMVVDLVVFPDKNGQRKYSELIILMGTAVICGLAVLINPFGLDMWKIPFNTVGIETLQDLINEWASPDFHQAFQQPFLVMLLGILFIFGISNTRIPGRTILPVIIFAWAALTARRNFGPFAIVAAPPMATYGSRILLDWISSLRTRWPKIDNLLKVADSNKKDFSVRLRNIINFALVFLLVLAAVIKTIEVNDPALFAEKENQYYPAGAANWLAQQEEDVQLFNDYNWGGYLIYKSPDIKVFVDGRTDLFGDEILSDYMWIMRSGQGWEKILDKYNINAILLRESSAVPDMLTDHGWQIEYQDQTAVILLRD